jgi:hypothetical protein
MTRHENGTVDVIDASTELLQCCTLPRIDHVDAHLAHCDSAARGSPELWAREIMECTSAAMRLRLRAGWTMLGIGLHHRDPDTVAGWPITHNSAEYARLHSVSHLGLTGELVTRVDDNGIVFATFAQLDTPLARSAWARVLPTHLRIVRSLLQDAVERVR